MHYSYRIEQAIRAATILHKDQVRKGDVPYPYVTHLYAVALIAADYTDSEDIIVAALLHDTLEDTDYTREELNEDFGHAVAEIVECLTRPTLGSGASWYEIRKEYAKKLKDAPHDALIVAAADKIHNMRSMVETYFDNHDRLSADFGGTLEERMLMNQEISNIFNRRLKNGILSEFNHVFDEFKKFIEEVEKQREKEAAGY